MPESPDFRKMALDLTWTVDNIAAITAIEEQLRLVWNARGAADLAKIDATVTYTTSGRVEGSRKQLDHAIRSLDR